MHRWQDRRRAMRKVLNSDQCFFPASVHDPISARIAKGLDYEVGMFAGSVASLTVLGAPDLILLTLTEFAQQALRINRASELPLLVDADHGYGNALNVMRCVEELETAGVAALSIEDTDLPVHSADGKASLLSVEAGVGKMRAAVQARRDPDLIIAGRTSAPAITDAADAAVRLSAYEQAGVDALFVVGIKGEQDLQTITQATSLPIILGSAPASVRQADVLKANRVRICLLGHQPFAAATQAIYETMKRLRNGESPADLPGVAGADTMKSLVKDDDYQGWIKQFL